MGAGHHLLSTTHGDLDCLGEGLSVHVIDLPTLIDLKEKAGRPKDLAVLPVLRATLAETRRRA